MAGTVFLSCGQNKREMQIAKKVEELLSSAPFNLSVFIARATNNLYSLNNDVLDRLAYADYVVFINFRREKRGFSGSLYSHQELAMALALGHRQLLIFSEKGAPRDGVIRFMHQNSPCFTSDDKLLEQLKKDITKENWRSDYSRFLRVKEEVLCQESVTFSDETGNKFNGKAIRVAVENQSNELQEGVIITLEELDGKPAEYMFRSPVKV